MAKKKRHASPAPIDTDNILGAAYTLSEVRRDRAGALAHLRSKSDGDEATAAALKTKMYAYRDVVKARTMGRYCGDHVSKVLLDLLAEAFAPKR
jgi:hypothetical protein